MTYGYDGLIDEMGVTVLVKEEDSDYQGDSRYLIKEGRRYGILVFGWGSCSGCDAYEAAGGDPVELRKLRDQLYGSIHWERGPRAMLDYVETADFTLKFGSWASFVEKARTKLEDILDNR